MNDASIAILTRNLGKVYRIYKNPIDAIKESADSSLKCNFN